VLVPDPLPFVTGGLLAYGPAPGLELIPYFLGLLAWAGLAIGAVLLSPISALLRRLRRGRGAHQAEESGVRSQESEVGSQRSEIRDQKSEVGSQRSEIRDQKSEVGSQ